MKSLKGFRLTLWTVVAGVCWLAGLSIGVPLLIGKIFFHTDNSVYTTQYVLGAYIVFFLIFLGIIIPVLRWAVKFFHTSKTSPVDAVLTVLIALVSFVPLSILAALTLPAIRSQIFEKYKYKIFNFSISATLFQLGVLVRYHGHIQNKNSTPVLVIMNHTSPVEYLLACQSMGTSRFNIVAGINLAKNMSTFGDKCIAWTLGKVVEEHSISLDRGDEISRQTAGERIIKELKAGKNVAIFPEGTRTMAPIIFKDHTLLQPFWDGIFRIAYATKTCIQPLVFDWPVIWRGKNDPRFGIRPTRIDAYFEEVVDPNDFESFEALRNHCWEVMHSRLASSKKIKRFLKSVSPKNPS